MALNIKSLFSLGHPRPKKISRYILAAPLAPPTDTQTYDCAKQPVNQQNQEKESDEGKKPTQKPTSKEIAAKMRKKLNVI